MPINLRKFSIKIPSIGEFSIFMFKTISMLNTDLLNKLQDLKRQSEDSKTRLSEMEISEDSGNGMVRITMNGNRILKLVEINADLTEIDKEDLEDLIGIAFNRVLSKVDELNEKEVMSSAQSLLSGM